MKELLFQQIDVFTKKSFKGNPVAVILEGDNLSTKEMQTIANWMNLSETTFICRSSDPMADYKLRIFSTQSELPFAGHPTIGSAFAFYNQNKENLKKDYIIQECGQGLIKIYIESDKIFLTLPEYKIKEIQRNQIEQFSEALGIPVESIKEHAIIDVGAVWITLQITNGQEVISLRPDFKKISALTKEVTGLTIFGLNDLNDESDMEVRSFAPNEGANEDPVCGSGNGCVAILVKNKKLISNKNYVASQGICMGRDGKVEIKYQDDGEILLGGDAVTCIQGFLKL
ncbi:MULTISPECIES: PhzF family phenazine biosynthesis protein [unclassified Enterococcus]|uniref:PhzF family phenazine biosynthesis protein n=1 Tax=unclassified Enterococcus TaxID=2608891 RepID=UPI001C12D035|nr:MULTISPECIES: PhzF family phenazine biosynthesis protein [unclassified Enterococcus]